MNSELQAIIETLVSDLPEADRDEARKIINACNFSDANDPLLGVLRYLQLRVNSMGDKERPQAAAVRQLALELDNRLWETRRLKWGFFAMCVIIAFFFGGVVVGGLNLYAARVNPSWASNYFGLPIKTAPDERLIEMQNAGIFLRVQDKPTEFLIGLKGNFVDHATGSDGEQVLLFKKQP